MAWKTIEFTEIKKKLVENMKNWNMGVFVIFTHMLSSYIFWLNLLFILWFSLPESWFCTRSRGQMNGSWFDHQRLWALLMVPIGGNKFENVVSQMAAILSWPQCVKWWIYLTCGFSDALSAYNVERVLEAFFLFWVEFQWSLFLGIKLTIIGTTGSSNDLLLSRRQVINWINNDPV